MSPAQTGPPIPAPKRRVPVFVWIIVAIIGLFLLAAIAMVATGLAIAHKVSSSKGDAKQLVSQIVSAINPEADVISVDDKTGTVTIRDKKENKTLTVSLDDLKQGRINLHTDDSDVVIGGQGKIPKWVLLYPGAEGHGKLSTFDAAKESGTAIFTLPDSESKVIDFYEAEFPAKGFTKVSREHKEKALEITAVNEKTGRKIVASIGRSDQIDTTALVLVYSLVD